MENYRKYSILGKSIVEFVLVELEDKLKIIFIQNYELLR